jgi:hypothetical protein
MIHHEEILHLSSFGFAAAIMLLSAALAQAEEIEVPLSGARLAEITIASTESIMLLRRFECQLGAG